MDTQERGALRCLAVAIAAQLATLAMVVAALWPVASKADARLQLPDEARRYQGLMIRTARAVWGMDAPVATFAAQVHQESGWRANAISHVGAQGLAQFMPATADWAGRNWSTLADPNPYNPAWALRALVSYDQWLYQRAPERYSLCDRMWVALRGYNGGLGHWQAEARASGLQAPTRHQVDAACGKAKRAALHCRENLDYPARILLRHEPRYEAAGWGAGSCP